MDKDIQLDYGIIKETAGFLIHRIHLKPTIGIISGTGLECLSDLIKDPQSFPVAAIPHFPSIEPNERHFLFGTAGDHPVVILSKRLHVYEGYSMAQIAFVVRLLRELGVKILIITNAAGGLNPLYSPGQIMLIVDHINLMGGSPLIGPNWNMYGPRFPDMTSPYDPALIHLLEGIALKQALAVWKGIYVGVVGPHLETRAETRFLRAIGADAVGMSTVPEVIAAVHCGIRVLGLSVLSNVNLPDYPKKHTLEEIEDVVYRASPGLRELLNEFLNALPGSFTDEP